MITLLYRIKNFLSSVIKIYFLFPTKYPTSLFFSVCPEVVLNSRNSEISKGVVFHNWKVINRFGNNIFIGENTFINSCSEIGSFSSISSGVKIGLKNHNLDLVSTSPFFYNPSKTWGIKNKSSKVQPCRIGADVLVSANSIIMEGISLGVGSIIGAGSFVNNDVPPYAVVGGVPARVLKYRFNESEIKLLIKSQWWELDPEKIISLSKFFNDPKKFVSKAFQISHS